MSEHAGRTSEVVVELDQLRRWKAEALPVIAGLQEVGRALGLRLGENITGRIAVDAALDLRNAATSERERAQTAVVDVLEPLIDQAWNDGNRDVWDALSGARRALLVALGTPCTATTTDGAAT